MKVLITGANGFTGSHLVKYLRQNSDLKLYCITRSKKKDHDNVCDLTDYELITNFGTHKTKHNAISIAHKLNSGQRRPQCSQADIGFTQQKIRGRHPLTYVRPLLVMLFIVFVIKTRDQQCFAHVGAV